MQILYCNFPCIMQLKKENICSGISCGASVLLKVDKESVWDAACESGEALGMW